jgi:type I restriction enzyme S subunit
MSQRHRVVLRDLCDLVQYGYTASASAEAIGPKFLRITDIVQPMIDWSAVPFCAIETAQREKFLLRHGDIVIARTGATVGYAKRLKHPPDAVFASYLVRLRLRSDVDGEFVGAVIESSEYKRFIAANAGGAAQPNANAQVLSSFVFDLPPLKEQRRIGALLSAYDDLIENNARRIAILEEMARRIYEEWFVRFRFPGHEGVRMIESELGLVPEGWRAATVEDIAERIGATVNPGAFPDEQFEHYSIPAFDAARRATLEPGRGIMSNKTLLNRDAVLVSKLNPRIPRIWAVSGSSTRRRVCSTEFIPFIPRPPYTRRLLYLFFTSAWFQERYLGLAVGTSTSHQRVKPADTEAISVIVPTECVASMANDLLAPVLDLAENLRLKVANLRTTRDLLLPKLISGELELSAAPEPEALAA